MTSDAGHMVPIIHALIYTQTLDHVTVECVEILKLCTYQTIFYCVNMSSFEAIRLSLQLVFFILVINCQGVTVTDLTGSRRFVSLLVILDFNTFDVRFGSDLPLERCFGLI